jgi:hypothetical protein
MPKSNKLNKLNKLKKLNIIKNCQYTPDQIAKIEDRMEAKYICDMCLIDDKGNYSNSPASYFYTEKAHPEGSNYFTVYEKFEFGVHLGTYISDGINITDVGITGIVATNGDVIYSRYRHDYVKSPDDSVSADGGLEYGRFGFQDGVKPEYCALRVDVSELVVLGGEV